MVSTIASILAECLYRQGRYDEADEHARGGRRAGRGRRRRHPGARARGPGEALPPGAGSSTRPKPLAREGVALAAATEFVDLRGDSLLALAEVLRLAGRKDEAAEATRQALAIWEAKGNVVHRGTSRALLAAALTAAWRWTAARRYLRASALPTGGRLMSDETSDLQTQVTALQSRVSALEDEGLRPAGAARQVADAERERRGR